VTAVALAGCGGDVVGNLVEIHRDGSIPGARLTLLVKDDGRVSCNGKPLELLPGDLLLDARDFVHAVNGDIRRYPTPMKSATYPPGPDTVLRYRVRTAEDHFAFSDTSKGVPKPLSLLQGFTRRIAKDVCGLPR
jgi:hypothetical protein